MDFLTAHFLARKYSIQYLTWWYVREVSSGKFEPYAHDSDDERTFRAFYNGKEEYTHQQELKYSNY